MIITDYNQMSIIELEAISGYCGIKYVIEDGKITEAKDGDEDENRR